MILPKISPTGVPGGTSSCDNPNSSVNRTLQTIRRWCMSTMHKACDMLFNAASKRAFWVFNSLSRACRILLR